MPRSSKPVVLVVTSTLPRWADDTEPRFILDLCLAVAGRYRVRVLAPHCRGAATAERWGEVEVRRFRYMPAWAEVLAYEGGMLPKLRRRPWLWVLVPAFLVALVIAIVRELRRDRVAVVHAHWLIPQGLCVRVAQGWAGRATPLVCTAHGADVFGLRGGLAWMLQRWVARGCIRVGTVSEALSRELVRRGVAADAIRLLPMGVSLASVASPIDREKHLIAFAGRIVEKKGVDVLIEAFHRVLADCPEARLCVAGGGPDLERCRQLAASLGLRHRVEFLGAVPHGRVRELFAQATVAVMPSVTARDGDSEGLGLVMLEAMAASCPVVVTDLPAVRGVIRPGDNGLLFPERDATALADRVLQVLRDRGLAARLGAAGYREVQARFDWRAVAANHETTYAEALAAR